MFWHARRGADAFTPTFGCRVLTLATLLIIVYVFCIVVLLDHNAATTLSLASGAAVIVIRLHGCLVGSRGASSRRLM